jgi:hypothetical protein
VTDPAPDPGAPAFGAEPPPRASRRTLLRWALPVAGILLLAAVLWKVPWSDRAFLRDGSEVRGRILSEKDDVFLFQVAGEGSARTLAPADLLVRPRDLPPVEEGVLTLAGRVALLPVLGVLAISLATILVASVRWRLLLRTQGVDLRIRDAVALMFLGNFFTQVVPGGMVGGDVLKALYAARGREKAALAVVSVFVDRVLGLFGTVILACVALLPRWQDPRFHGHALMAYGVLVAGLAGAAVVLSRRVRRALRVESWVPRLPLIGGFLSEADQAVLSFRERKGVILAGLGMSVGIHVSWCAAHVLMGATLGVDPARVHPTDYFAVIPPILIVSVIPLLPGGWGIGEASYVFFLGLLGVPPAQAVAMSILGRVMTMISALPGGFVFLARRA